MDCILLAFPLSGAFLRFFYSVGLPTADPCAPLYQPVELYIFFFLLNKVNRLQLLLSWRQFSFTCLSLCISLYILVYCFSPASFALTLPQKESRSCLPGLSSNPHVVRQPVANGPMVSPVGLVKVRSRSNTLTKFDWEKSDVCLLNLLQASGSSPHINTLPISCQMQADHWPRSMHIFFYFLQRDNSQRKSQRHWETTQNAWRPALNSSRQGLTAQSRDTAWIVFWQLKNRKY